MQLATWLQFFLACWLISLSPGAGAIASMGCGLRYPYQLAIFNILGLIVGIFFLVLIVALGLGAVLAASETAFTTIKWLGVAYLIWLGVQQWRAPVHTLSADEAQAAAGNLPTPRALFTRAFFINASNPKGIVFMLAVLPQFIDIARPQALQYALCALTLGFTDFIVMTGYTLLAAKVLTLLRTPRQVRLLNRSFASLFVGAGLLLASFKKAA